MVVKASGTSHAKIILIGEHSVVYHQPAIALPLPAVRERVVITPTHDGQQRLMSRYFTGVRQVAPATLQGINYLIDTLLTRFDLATQSFELVIESHLPAERGMGSSAATAVAIIRALYGFAERSLNHAQLLEDANISERMIHGNPSGLDVATASADNPVWLVKGEQPAPMPFHLTGYLVIADTGVHGQTGEAVEKVAALRKSDPQLANQAIRTLGNLTVAARTALTTNQLSELGQIFDQAQANLVKLGVSHERLDLLIQVAKQNGALGAKLTGGGMGGCMICLAPTESSAAHIRQALAAAGATQSWVQPFISEENN